MMTFVLSLVIGVMVLEVIGLRIERRRLRDELKKQRRDTLSTMIPIELRGPLGYTVTYADGRSHFVVIGKGGEC